MKKIIAMAVVLSCILMGCSNPAKTAVSILSPSGAPSLGLVGIYSDVVKEGKVSIVEGSDLLSSELLKEDGEYDIIVAPINLGCQLIAKEATTYRLAGVLTWGNLYIVQNNDLDNGEFYAFGEVAVPGKILSIVEEGIDYLKDTNKTYYSAVSDVQAQVLAGKCQYALMAQPVAAATIAKGKELGLDLSIAGSIQNYYKNITQSEMEGYPQAAIFVKDGVDVSSTLNALKEFTNQDEIEGLEALIESVGADTLGLPNATIAANTWKAQNIKYVSASDVVGDITHILSQFNIEFNESMLLK